MLTRTTHPDPFGADQSVSPVTPRRRMRDSAWDPRVRKKWRQVAGCPDAEEPAGPPAETEEPTTIVGSVASKPIIKCHQAEECVSQDVVGE